MCARIKPKSYTGAAEMTTNVKDVILKPPFCCTIIILGPQMYFPHIT